MKKRISLVVLCLLLAIGTAVFTGCEVIVDSENQSNSQIDYGTMTIEDITLSIGESVEVNPIFSNQEYLETPEYTFDGENISIMNGVLTALIDNTETVVTAKTEHHECTFKVIVLVDYGTLTLTNLEVSFNATVVLNPVFSKQEWETDVEYVYEGENILIENGILKGIVPNTTTVVTAKTEYHETTFEVKVCYMQAELANESGAESKFGINTPDSENYVLTGKIEVEKWRENAWTRLSAFAFNVSDNSWYNIELFGNGDVILYGRFNGVEKYNIKLFNINDDGIIINGKITYTVALVKTGEATAFYVNDKLVCSFNEAELAGYVKLGDIEITACANRENAGEYKVLLSEFYYQTEGSDLYEKYALNKGVLSGFGDVVLGAEDGLERKFIVYRNIAEKDFVFSTTVSVDYLDNSFTRVSSFAFNSSDNSWYNIEMNGDGNFILYGRFNGVEKYHIHLFNKNDAGIIVDGKITYTIDLLKKGANTYFFVNGKFVACFNEEELVGYPELSSFEFTSASEAWWHDGSAYQVVYKNTEILSANTQKYEQLLKLATDAVVVENATLVSDNGAERKLVIAKSGMNATHSHGVVSMKITVDAFDATAWFRSSALAFNGSDNSWYNIELGGDGNVTLFARFNGVEKYFIHLFNLNDEGIIVDGKLTYTLTILRKGQATWLFVNDVMVCSFSKEELNGYPLLDYLELTACADRSGKAFEVSVSDIKIESSISENYVNLSKLVTDAVVVENATLVSDNGAERKLVIAKSGMNATHSHGVVSMKITVDAFDATAWFRSSALAFNGSDNSWYNIELGGDGNVTLFARFNGVEKYFIHLFNLNDEGIIVDGKLTYTLTILRKGQATWLFVNDVMVCSFSKEELNGYPLLDYLELTACADRSGKAFEVSVSDIKIESSISENYAKYSTMI